jgi:hypothetical protein
VCWSKANDAPQACRISTGVVTSLAILSMAVGNGLVLAKVVALWENDRVRAQCSALTDYTVLSDLFQRVRRLMISFYFVCHTASWSMFLAWASTQIRETALSIHTRARTNQNHRIEHRVQSDPQHVHPSTR